MPDKPKDAVIRENEAEVNRDIECIYEFPHTSRHMAEVTSFGVMSAANLLSHLEEISMSSSRSSFTGVESQSAVQKLEKKMFRCPNCGREYQYQGNLKQHMRFECGKEPQLQCPYCPKKVKLKGNLKQHIILVHKQGRLQDFIQGGSTHTSQGGSTHTFQ